jgi:hypothetical protein
MFLKSSSEIVNISVHLKIKIDTGLFTRGVLVNFYFGATNNTNGSN